jgi:hypothetical protein
MRNLMITLILGLILSLLLGGCSLFRSSATPTPTLSFVTVTPGPGGSIDLPTPTPMATGTPTPTLVPTATPTPTSTPLLLPTSTPVPQAIINGPQGFVNVRSGPGPAYGPPLGTYNNGTVVEVLGKQYATGGELWWLIDYPPGLFGKGWVLANETIAQNVDNVSWVTAPVTPTPTSVTPTSLPRPHAIIDSPSGYLYVRSGPGVVYQPPLGAFNNDTIVEVIGKQVATDGRLWWLVPFISSPTGQGWIFADYTIAKYTNNVPWVTAPPTPTITPTPTSTPTTLPVVNWTITGRVVDVTTKQPIVSASVKAVLGNDGTSLTTLTDSNGNFSIVASASDEGNLVLTINAQGYAENVITGGPRTPRIYDFPAIELTQQGPPTVTWVVFGRVIEIGTANPVSGAQVEAFLGVDAVRLETVTGANGDFSLNGQARDQGALSLKVTAEGYQTLSQTSPQTDSRIYNLADLSLVPLAGSCAYESVINLSQTSALARLQNLNFTNVTTTSVTVGGDPNLIDRVLTQDPDPPPEGQSKRLSCQLPITLEIGVREEGSQ